MVHSNSDLVARMGLLILVLFVNLALVSTASAEPPPPRNILFIAIDDLRNWVHYSGDYEGIVHTPNIDALAAVSTRYLNAYATVPQCVGSRTSVLMGLSPATHHITFSSWGIEPQYHAVYSNPTLLSLPQVMTLSGYHTATTGKVFGIPLPDRWDEVGPDSEPLVCDFCPGPDNTFMAAEVLPDTEEHTDQTVTNWVVDFIENYDRSEPFFLAAGLYQPHVPWRVPQWAYDLYPIEDVVVSTPIANDLDDEPALAVQLATAQNPFTGLSQYEMVEYAGKAAEYTQAYLASISHTDAMVGQLLAAVAASPFASTTDIILWSDHGYHLGEKFHWRKNTLWDQSVKVPLLVSAPGNANYPVGDVFTPVSLLDVAPTVLDLTGITPFVQFEGVPLRDGASASPVEIYFNDGRALVRPRLGRKMIDYDLTTAQGSVDRASYTLTDIHEETNIYTNIGC